MRIAIGGFQHETNTFAPAKARGKLLGFTQVAWCLGPVVVLWMALALAPWGLLGIRIVFLHLFVVAVITWALRRGLAESARWKEASKAAKGVGHNLKALFSGSNLRAIVWTATIYLFWNLAAGTAGIFNPYIISTLNAGSQAMSVGLSSASFVIVMIVTVTVFMKYSDRDFRTRKLIWGTGAVMQVISYGIFLWHSTIMLELNEHAAQGWLPGSGFLSLLLERIEGGLVLPEED